MKKVLLVAAFSCLLCACDGGGYVTREEAAQAFQQRDRALQVIAEAVKDLQERELKKKGAKK